MTRPAPIPTDYWSTPRRAVRAIEQRLRWRFVLDLAATRANAICPWHISESDDVLEMTTDEIGDRLVHAVRHSVVGPYERPAAWMNPPYSRGLVNLFVGRWCQLAESNSMMLALLVRADNSASWYQQAASVATAQLEFDQRIKFAPPTGKTQSSNNMSSVCFVYDPLAIRAGRVVETVKIKGFFP